MRRINFKFLLCLIIPAVLIAAGVHFLWAFNVDRSTDLVLEKAELAMEEGDLREALKLYTLYLNRNPDDKEHICEAALASVEIIESEDVNNRDIGVAYKLMERALRKSPERTDIRRHLVELLVRARVFGEARKHITEIGQRGEADTKLDYYYALCSYSLNETDTAVQRLYGLVGYNEQNGKFESGLARAPEMVEAHTLLASILWRRGTGGRADELLADAVMKRLVTENPDSSEAFLAKGRYLRETNKIGGATEQEERSKLAQDDLRKALSLDPGNVSVLLENADLAMDDEDFEAADRYLTTALETAPDDRRIYIKQTRLARLQRDPDGGKKYLKAGLEVIENDPMLVWLLFDSHLIAREQAEARQIIERMKKLKIPTEYVSLAAAKVLVVEGKWREASEKLEDLRPQMTLYPVSMVVTVDNLLGQCYERLRQPDRQLDAFANALVADPRSRPALLGHASALLALKRNDEALGEFRALRREVGAEAFDSDRVLLGKYMQLLNVLSEDNPTYKKELEALKQRFAAQEGSTDIDQGMIAVHSMLEKKDLDQARRSLEAMLRKHPQESRLQFTYLDVLVRLKGPEAGLKFLEKAMGHPTSPWPDASHFRLRRAGLISSVGGPAAAGKIEDLEKGIGSYTTREQAALWRGFAQAYYSLIPRDVANARRCLESASAIAPQDEQIVQVMFELELENGNEREMARIVTDVEKRFGKDSGLWSYMQARYLLWQYDQQPGDVEQLSEVGRLARKIRTSRPGWNKLLQLQAAVNQRQGKFDQAIQLYRDSLQLGPADPFAIQQMVGLMIRQKLYAEARAALNELDTIPAALRRQKIELDILAGDKNSALSTLSDVASGESSNPYDVMWRGQVLARLEKSAEAEQAFRNAVRLAPGLSQAWILLVTHLVQAGRVDDAEREVRNAENRLSEDSAPSTLGQCYALLGNNAMAEHYLQVALNAKPSDDGRARMLATLYMSTKQFGMAVRYLDSIVEMKVAEGRTHDPSAMWARRSLARIMAGQPNFQAFPRALGLIEANRVNGQLGLEDLRLKAQMLSSRVEPIYRQHGLELFEKIPVDQLSEDERLMLARLYYLRDDWREARVMMDDLIADNPKNVQLLASYAEMLLEHNETAQARLRIQRLLSIAPKRLETVQLAARMESERGKDDVAIAHAESLLPRTIEAADAGKVLAVARILEGVKQFGAAEKKYRQLATLDKNYGLHLGAYLARRGKFDEAFQICNQLLSKNTVREICAVAVAALTDQAATAKSKHYSQVAEWIAFAKKEFPTSGVLVTQEASLLDGMGKSDEAIRLLESLPLDRLPAEQRGLIVNNRAYLKMKLGQSDERALQDINDALDLIGPRIELLDTRAMIHLSRGDCDSALRDLEEATMFKVNSGIYYFHLALAHKCGDNQSSARSALKIADKIGFTEADVAVAEREQYAGLKRWLLY